MELVGVTKEEDMLCLRLVVVEDTLEDVGFDWNLILRIMWKASRIQRPLSHGKVCVLTESLHRVLESFKVSYRNRSYCITATEFAYWALNIESTEDKSMTDSLERKYDEVPSLDGGPEHEEPLDVDNCDLVLSKDNNNDSDSSSEMSSTSRLMREVDVRGVDSDHVDSFEEGEIIGDSVLNNDGCVKDCMEKNLDDDVEKDIEDCSKNVTAKCGVVNNNMSNNVEGEILEDHFDGDRRNDTIEDNADVNPSTNVYLDVNQNTSILEVVEDFSSFDRSSDKAERLVHHNNGLDDLDISLRNKLLHQDKCRVRPVKAAVNDSSIVSPSTPPGTVLNLAEVSCSTWLDYVGPIITDELDSEKRWGNSRDTYNSNGVKGAANSYAHVVKGSQNSKMDSDSSPVMVLDDSCLNEKDYSLCLLGKAKDFATLANLKVVVANEGFDNIKFKYMGGYWVMMEFQIEVTKLKFQKNSVMKTWFSQIQLASFDFNTDGRVTWVEIKGKVFWVRAKEVPGWIPDFVKDNDEEEDSKVGSYEEV
nr:nucleotide-binding alpha-beta plait domain-containing protein [Tanacetum cinerariifolium]